jgi:hypothetical protein
MRHARSLLAALLLLAVPTTTLAKLPSKKDVDSTLLGVSSAKLGPVRDAEDTLHDMEQHQTAVESELAIAKLDVEAAKAWVDASKAVSAALEASEKAAQGASRTDELEDLAARKARAKQTTEWREARWNAARQAVTMQQARLTLAKSEIARAQLQVELARLQVYDEAIGGSADVAIEMGKVQTKVGRAGTQVGKDLRKAEQAEREYDDAVSLAGQLDPSM